MSTDTKNWIVKIYSKSNKVKKSFEIKDRTESEANKEAMVYIEQNNITSDWTLTPTK